MVIYVSHNVLDFLFIKFFKNILLFRIYNVLVNFILAQFGVQMELVVTLDDGQVNFSRPGCGPLLAQKHVLP